MGDPGCPAASAGETLTESAGDGHELDERGSGVAGPAVFSTALWGAFILAILAGCEPELVPLPQADEPIFVRLADIRLGMRQSEVLRQRPSIEASRDGELQEADGAWWITYGFQHSRERRLYSVRLWREFTDSLSLRDRRHEVVRSLRSAYGFDPQCYRGNLHHMEGIRLIWQGTPNTGISSQTIASPDGRGYRSELVVLVGLSDLPFHSEPVPCEELDELDETSASCC